VYSKSDAQADQEENEADATESLLLRGFHVQPAPGEFVSGHSREHGRIDIAQTDTTLPKAIASAAASKALG
jgi:hypothetical protein